MKINSKALTSKADQITKAQAQLSDSEIQASKLLQSFDDALTSHKANTERLLQITAQREKLCLDINSPVAKLNRLDTETRNCQQAIRETQGAVDSIKAELSVIADVLEQEQSQRHDQAAQANTELLQDVLNTEDLQKAWAIVRGYWRLSGCTQGDLIETLSALDVEVAPMPELCSYRGSETLEDINRVVNAGS